MGSPISCLVAEAVMQRLEEVAIPLIEPNLWMRYVDDTFVIIKRSIVEEAHAILNNVFKGINFTIELEHEGQLPFLDIMVKRSPSNTLETSVYRKATDTSQILNYNSNHPAAHKKSCIRTLFKRIESHCSTAHAKAQERRHLYWIFQQNGYPHNYIRRSLRNYQCTRNICTNNSEIKRFVLPYRFQRWQRVYLNRTIL